MRRNLEKIIIAIIILILVVPICYKKYMSPQNIMKRYAKKNNFGKVKDDMSVIVCKFIKKK